MVPATAHHLCGRLIQRRFRGYNGLVLHVCAVAGSHFGADCTNDLIRDSA
jgi:hypothetical protein